MKIKFVSVVILINFFYIHKIQAVTKYPPSLTNNTKNVITTEILNLYKTSEAISEKIILKKVTHNQCEKCTKMKRSIDRILPRRKRFLIYPSASNVVVTLSLVKALTFSTPRGYNFLGEVDFYYPLPNKIYYPHHRTTTTEVPSPPPTMSPDIFDHHNAHLPTGWDHDQSNEIFMPSGGWKDDIFKNINADETPIEVANSSRRYWNENLSYRNSYTNFRPPSFQSKSRRRQGKRSTEKSENEKVNKLKNHDNSDKTHRDLRDLYSQIELIFQYKGIQIKTCILRAICEAKYFLLPKGKSLFQDIFRILFTIPIKNEANDDYSNAERNHHTSENCWKLYENECPISILEFLLKSQKVL